MKTSEQNGRNTRWQLWTGALIAVGVVVAVLVWGVPEPLVNHNEGAGDSQVSETPDKRFLGMEAKAALEAAAEDGHQARIVYREDRQDNLAITDDRQPERLNFWVGSDGTVIAVATDAEVDGRDDLEFGAAPR